jgi:hypothetical protein
MIIRCAKSLLRRRPDKKSPRRNYFRSLRSSAPKIRETTVRIIAKITISPDEGPDPKIIGIGPIKITVPTLPTFPPLIIGPRDIKRMPTKIITNARKSSPVTGTCAFVCTVCGIA